MKYETIVLKKANIEDFAQARNKALSEVEWGEWILFLDSDETVSSGLNKELADLRPDPEVRGYYITRKGVVEEKLLRLAKKGSGVWRRQVHEIWDIKGEVKYLKNPIIHQDNQNLRRTLAKINFYSTLHARANKEEGKKATLFKIIFYPKVKFLQTFFVKKGYKSGLEGFVFSLFQAFGSFLSWTKLYFSQF